MPNNRIIYYGIVLLAATVALWIGAELTSRVKWLLPYAGGVAVAMIVGGFIYQSWRGKPRQEDMVVLEKKPTGTGEPTGEPGRQTNRTSGL